MPQPRFASHSLLQKNAYYACAASYAAIRSLRSLASRRPNGPPARYLGIFCQAGSRSYPDALRHFRALYRPFRKLGNTAIIVDNEPDIPPKLLANEHYMAGSNSAWEFSAWQEALDRQLAMEQTPPDWVICITSAFTRNRPLFRFSRFLHPQVLDHASPQVGLIGNACVHPIGDWKVLEYDCRRFVSTCGFAIRGNLACQLGFSSAPAVGSMNHCSKRETTLASLLAEAPVSAAFRTYLNDWLGHEWYRSVASADSAPWVIRGKLQAILNERLLTARVAETGSEVLCPLRTVYTKGIAKLASLSSFGQ